MKALQIQNEISSLLRARNTLLWIVSREEMRAERSVIEAAGAAKYEVLLWDCATGLSNAAGETQDGRMTDPQAIVKLVRSQSQRRVYVLRDLHRWLADPVLTRALRSLARDLQSVPRNEARAVVILSPSGEVPPDLAGQTMVLDFPLPDRPEMSEILDNVLAGLPDELSGKVCENGVREAAIDAAMGLSAEEAASCYAKSLVTKKVIEPAVVSAEKRKVISRERVLSWIEPDPRGLDAVGGLNGLKAWLVSRRLAFGKAAREYGLPCPRGVMLAGVPGCGKSLTAKAVATAWGIPLLRMDLGALKSKWVGESEANIRKALAVAETVSPCILWLDEIEKSLAGSAGGAAADGGVSADALGSILSWMQERQGSVFVVATANDVEILPAELLRKGRFDEIFFVDLPQLVERSAIVESVLEQFGRGDGAVDALEVAEATEGFSGAELAALIPDAMFAAFSDGEREVTTDDLLEAARVTVPLSKTSAERINKIREWAKGRARPASAPIKMGKSRGRAIDLEKS